MSSRSKELVALRVSPAVVIALPHPDTVHETRADSQRIIAIIVGARRLPAAVAFSPAADRGMQHVADDDSGPGQRAPVLVGHPAKVAVARSA